MENKKLAETSQWSLSGLLDSARTQQSSPPACKAPRHMHMSVNAAVCSAARSVVSPVQRSDETTIKPDEQGWKLSTFQCNVYTPQARYDRIGASDETLQREKSPCQHDVCEEMIFNPAGLTKASVTPVGSQPGN